MELAKIESLLERYFEGNTSLYEEQELRSFFSEGTVPTHLAVYKPIFMSFEMAGEETLSKEINLPSPQKRSNYWKLGIAASLLVCLGIAGYMFSNSGLSLEEQEALAAFKKTQETMLMFSQNFNQGTASLTHLGELENGISSLQVLNEFNESKNLILK
ncbi:MAG: hypothetical protein K0U54_06260 [Bacteroidetes bacterium]|nr:hypothetical protein [Bacteroidota bacterium]